MTDSTNAPATSVGASLLAKKAQTPRSSRMNALTLAVFASKLAPTVGLAMLLSACAIGPDYKRPDVIEPVQFKEAQGWRQANPSDSLARGAWWELYGDRQLNDLVVRLNASNQTVAQAEARFRPAKAVVRS